MRDKNGIKNTEYYAMFNAMDLIVRKMRNPKIYSYWKKNCFKDCCPVKITHPRYMNLTGGDKVYYLERRCPEKITYTKYMNLTGGGKVHFLETYCKIRKIYNVFYHCIHMSIDGDVEEYINTLNAIEDNIRRQDD